MSLSDITSIQIREEGNKYLYEVDTEEACIGKIKILLTRSRNIKNADIIECVSDWNISNGTAAVDKEKLKDISDLYVCLRDEDTKVTGTAVKVYYEALSLKKWYITENRELVLLPERGKSAYEFSQKLILSYKNKSEIWQEYMLNLPDSRIGLEMLDLWENSPSFTFCLGYYMEDEGAKIWGACCQPVTIYIAPPRITGTVFSGGKVTVSGDFAKDVSFIVQIYNGRQSLGEVELIGKKADISKLQPDEGQELLLQPYYRTQLGESLRGDKAEVLLKEPRIESCRLEDKNWIITMNEPGTYDISYGENKIRVKGSTLQVPEETKEISVSCIKGNAGGPSVCYTPQERAVYPFPAENGVVYLACDRSDGCSLNKDIVINLGVKYCEAAKYDGTYFVLKQADAENQEAAEEAGIDFIIKKEIFSGYREKVHADYQKLLQKAAADKAIFSKIKSAVREKLPMGAEEQLFYYYDYCPESGWVGICEGMNLMTEYTLYQNIPDKVQKSRDLSGYVGTGTAGYQVVRRDKKLKIEPFASEMNFVVPPPASMESNNKLCGGAGIADLVYTGFSAEYMRLVYPAEFTDRNSTGNLCYDRNICLISSSEWDTLSEATENMRKGGLGINGVSYHYFRGRTVVVPQICISVNGNTLWVSLGTRLSDISENFGGKKGRLYRMIKGERIPVKYRDGQIPLLAGDCIEM